MIVAAQNIAVVSCLAVIAACLACVELLRWRRRRWRARVVSLGFGVLGGVLAQLLIGWREVFGPDAIYIVPNIPDGLRGALIELAYFTIGFGAASGTTSLIRVCRRLRNRPRDNGSSCCVTCGYPLWGLTQPRCPECGTSFDPSDLQFPTVPAHATSEDDQTQKPRRP